MKTSFSWFLLVSSSTVPTNLYSLHLSGYLSYYNLSSVCLSVSLFVCSPTPPRSFDQSSPILVGVCRWTSELSLRGSFLKRSTGHFFGHYIIYNSRRHQAETTLLQKAHGKSFARSTGIFTSCFKTLFQIVSKHAAILVRTTYPVCTDL